LGGTSGSLWALLPSCRSERLVAVLGIATPLSLALFYHGVDFICGARVTDVHALEPIR
jgi:uncharacterized protein (DUF4213/DUF364 family)